MTVLSLLAEQVEQAGVRTIDGNIVGDDSFFLNEPLRDVRGDGMTCNGAMARRFRR